MPRKCPGSNAGAQPRAAAGGAATNFAHGAPQRPSGPSPQWHWQEKTRNLHENSAHLPRHENTMPGPGIQGAFIKSSRAAMSRVANLCRCARDRPCSRPSVLSPSRAPPSVTYLACPPPSPRRHAPAHVRSGVPCLVRSMLYAMELRMAGGGGGGGSGGGDLRAAVAVPCAGLAGSRRRRLAPPQCACVCRCPLRECTLHSATAQGVRSVVAPATGSLLSSPRLLPSATSFPPSAAPASPARSRRCNNGHGIIRKYKMMLCRRCFSDFAEHIGFRKFR